MENGGTAPGSAPRLFHELLSILHFSPFRYGAFRRYAIMIGSNATMENGEWKMEGQRRAARRALSMNYFLFSILAFSVRGLPSPRHHDRIEGDDGKWRMENGEWIMEEPHRAMSRAAPIP